MTMTTTMTRMTLSVGTSTGKAAAAAPQQRRHRCQCFLCFPLLLLVLKLILYIRTVIAKATVSSENANAAAAAAAAAVAAAPATVEAALPLCMLFQCFAAAGCGSCCPKHLFEHQMGVFDDEGSTVGFVFSICFHSLRSVSQFLRPARGKSLCPANCFATPEVLETLRSKSSATRPRRSAASAPKGKVFSCSIKTLVQNSVEGCTLCS